MDLSNLKPALGATKSRKRIGRGQGSGYGGTSTRGHKGAKSRSGYSRKVGFEGGQMPLYRLVPKFGFKNINRVEYVGINLDTLEQMSEKFNTNDITVDLLKENCVVSRNEKVKVLGRGELTKAINVTVNAISKNAKAAIESKGGVVTII
ncbi:MAG: 50S ribosomal protein L15 [Bacteroidales bacterium]|jgi:large subunit ribosomal protein L15|nr:50S ribosomal protein L15 [Bacteroidales bacterium]MBQ6754421.1 50S ribosomal protein L15 [Bacteroidales bacterium]MDY6381293.1 50S ribosomal protein L15 [Bacteroidales bacterium]MDY6424562.1 50S ribosomal protein L15 [Bacteroidales bacterium]